MKKEYDAVHRNLRTQRSMRDYEPLPEPVWMAYMGGAVLGVLLAVIVWMSV